LPLSTIAPTRGSLADKESAQPFVEISAQAIGAFCSATETPPTIRIRRSVSDRDDFSAIFLSFRQSVIRPQDAPDPEWQKALDRYFVLYDDLMKAARDDIGLVPIERPILWGTQSPSSSISHSQKVTEQRKARTGYDLRPS
jgi:hypothetical protein